MTEEIWKDVVGYEGLYQVSNIGNVRSLDKYDSGKKFWPGRVMKLIVDKDGYLIVGLRKDRKSKLHKVHRLVAAAFIENPHNFPEVNHIDENKQNNYMENLEWCTTRYNVTYGHRLDCITGEQNHTAKLTPEDVREIRRTYIKGDLQYGQSALARKYGVSHIAIGCIVRGQTWKSQKYYKEETA